MKKNLPVDVHRAISFAEMGIASLPTEEEREAGQWAIDVITRGIARSTSRSISDAVTDQKRRILVGARLSRDDAARYKDCANYSARSLYRFVLDALNAEAEKIELYTHRTWDGKKHQIKSPFAKNAPMGCL